MNSTLTNRYSVYYNINISLIVKDSNIINIDSSDIVSLAIINNYDTMTFPIIRLRLYSDIRILQEITEYPNDINIRGNLDGGVYKLNDEVKTPVIVSTVKNIPFQLKVYIENKNTPTSKMDQYENGEKKSNDLNNDVKVPIELYCYDEKLVHYLKQKAPSIYKNMSILSIIEDVFTRSNILQYHIDPLKNQTKFDQVLIPNLNISQTLSFFDSRYGIYEKGAQLYGDIDKVYLCDTDVNNGTKPIPIYVNSSKSSFDTCGLKKTNNGFYMETLASNISILSETDIERTLQSPNILAVNVNSMDIQTSTLTKLYSKNNKDVSLEKITSPDLLHKTMNPYVTETHKARVNEKITRVDISGVGFDISKIKINSRYNLIFETPIRGMSMNEYYRTTFACHVLTNTSDNLFIAQTTMNLCSN